MFSWFAIGKKENKMAFTGYQVWLWFWSKLFKKCWYYEYWSVDPNFTGNRAIAGPKCKQYYTGTIWYTQAGVLLPNKAEKPKIIYSLWSFYL
jgi:hypothetical protein